MCCCYCLLSLLSVCVFSIVLSTSVLLVTTSIMLTILNPFEVADCHTASIGQDIGQDENFLVGKETSLDAIVNPL